jgi:hypothetical protein
MAQFALASSAFPLVSGASASVIGNLCLVLSGQDYDDALQGGHSKTRSRLAVERSYNNALARRVRQQTGYARIGEQALAGVHMNIHR